MLKKGTAMMIAMTLALAAFAQETPREVAEAFDNRRMDVLWDGQPFEEAVRAVADRMRQNIVIDARVRDEHGPAPIHLALHDVTPRTVLRLMLGERGLTIVCRKGVLVVVPIKEAHKPVMKAYDVRDLLHPRSDFAAPAMELDPEKPGIKLIDLDEDAKEVDPNYIEEMIKTATGQTAWANADEASIALVNGSLLVVRQTPEVHKEIDRILGLLRQVQ